MRVAGVIGVGLVCAAALALGGCASDPSQGYAFSSTYGTEIRTVAVPVFRNETFASGIETHLTEAIIKEIQRTTPWVVTGESDAETVLTGTIVSSDLRALSMGRKTGLVQEMSVRMVVDFTWVNNRTGQAILTRENFAAAETFVPTRRSGERLETGEHATVQELAREIVRELRSNW